MNERYTFVIAALVAELSASVIFYELSPTNPFCATFANLTNYVGQYAPLSLVLWVLAIACAWIFAGPQLIRPRQNLSTKVTLLAKLGATGVLIDNIISIYQLENAPEVVSRTLSSTAIAAGLAWRTTLYVTTFSLVVLISFLISRNQKQVVTPPPRFGRQ